MSKGLALSLIQIALGFYMGYLWYHTPHNWDAILLTNAIGFTAMYAKRKD